LVWLRNFSHHSSGSQRGALPRAFLPSPQVSRQYFEKDSPCSKSNGTILCPPPLLFEEWCVTTRYTQGRSLYDLPRQPWVKGRKPRRVFLDLGSPHRYTHRHDRPPGGNWLCQWPNNQWGRDRSKQPTLAMSMYPQGPMRAVFLCLLL
jgi:hypothetical protein